MDPHSHDTSQGPAGGRLGADLSAHVESIVRAAEREARVAEQAIADQRRSAEEEARRYLAAARLQVDAEAAARAARVETLSSAARRLSEELTDAVAALRRELARDAEEALPRTPWPAQAPVEPDASEAPAAHEPTPQPTWSRTEQQPPEPAATPPDADRAGGAGETHSAAPSAESPAPVDRTRPPARPGPEDEQPAANGHEPAVPSAARLVAIEMAVGGSARSEVEQHLRAELGVNDPQPLLDDVFGVASHAGSRLAWGEP